MEDSEMSETDNFVADLRAFAPYCDPCLEVAAQDGLCMDALRALSTRLQSAEFAMTGRVRRTVERHLKEVRDSPLVHPISLFKAIGLTRQETAHTRALAWLLDPHQPHGFGQQLLEAFLEGVRRANIDSELEFEALLDPEIRIKRVSPEFHLSSTCRVDILIEGDLADSTSFVILIEAKVGADERADQLGDYSAALRTYLGQAYEETAVLAIFLSEDGHAARTAAQTEWLPLDYLGIARQWMRVYPKLRTCPGHGFFRIYLTGLLEDVCRIRCQDSPEALIAHNSPAHLERLLEIDHA